jgi:hypothetical protein
MLQEGPTGIDGWTDGRTSREAGTTTQLGATSNYSAIANLHTLNITAANTKFSRCFQQPFPGIGC